MGEMLRLFQDYGGQGDQLSTVETILALLLNLVCTIIIIATYRFTHKTASYSQGYVHSLALLGLITTLIMVVIGSNIARAFSLVGALSIIRFRNAIKDTRDVAYIFFVMAIAMACGTRFYSMATIATAINCAVMITLFILNFGASRARIERLLTVHLTPGMDPEVALSPTLNDLFQSHSIVSIENARQGLVMQVILSVTPKPDVTGAQVIETISKVNDNRKITYNYASNTDDL